MRRGRIEVVGVGVDGGTDRITPGVRTEGVAVFVFREMDALDHDLGEVGEGAGGFGRDVAAGGGGKEASQGGVEIAGGEVMAGEEMSDFAAQALGGLGLVEFAGVETAEQRMTGLARRAAVAAVGEAEGTQRRRTSCRHESLLKVGFGTDLQNREKKNQGAASAVPLQVPGTSTTGTSSRRIDGDPSGRKRRGLQDDNAVVDVPARKQGCPCG